MDNNPIRPEMTIDALLSAYPKLAEVMVAHAMICVGCPISSFHTVADVANIYGLDHAGFIAELEQHIDLLGKGNSVKD